MKISLSNIKVAIFDFDNTLAIHKDVDYLKHRNKSEEKIIQNWMVI
jgi:FMN phosphatase YigB (HAD superfamily)